jgi:hypothetical protein
LSTAFGTADAADSGYLLGCLIDFGVCLFVCCCVVSVRLNADYGGSMRMLPQSRYSLQFFESKFGKFYVLAFILVLMILNLVSCCCFYVSKKMLLLHKIK